MLALPVGCATFGYRPYTPSTGGYEERPLSEEVYEVRILRRDHPNEIEFFATLGFSLWMFAIEDANGRWSEEGGDYALLRASQLALTNGQRYFAVDPAWSTRHDLVIRLMDESLDADTDTRADPDVVSHDALALQRRLLEKYASEGLPAVELQARTDERRASVDCAKPRTPGSAAP